MLVEFPVFDEHAIGLDLCCLEIFYIMKLPYSFIAIICISLASCGDNGDLGTGRQAVYVKPSIDSRGRFRKGHVRMPVSLKKNVMKSQNRSRYYYQTRGKYRRKKS